MAVDKGEWGEKLISNFVDSNLSSIFTFPNPKTKDNAQVADVLIWANRTIILIEVKTRDTEKSSTPITNWARNQTQKAVQQIVNGYNRIKAEERIFLHNKYYQTELDFEGLASIIGLVILVHEEDFDFFPSQAVSDIYNKELPISVISSQMLGDMSSEIDTVPDLIFYLNDKLNYLKLSDISIREELNLLGLYKKNHYKFPTIGYESIRGDYWNEYQTSMSEEIEKRNKNFENSIIIDDIESIFVDHRKLFDGIPIGLYFSWELGALPRTTRAVVGDKLASIREWFEKGNSSKHFAFKNLSTGNWIVFYFSNQDKKSSCTALEKYARLKLIQLVIDEDFKVGVYGLTFLFSKTYPIRLLGLGGAVVMSPEGLGEIAEHEVELSHRLWGHLKSSKLIEFPNMDKK